MNLLKVFAYKVLHHEVVFLSKNSYKTQVH